MFSPFGPGPFVGPQVGAMVNPTFQQTQLQVQVPQPPELSMPRFLNYLADTGGCGHYRLLWPEQIMNGMGMAISHSNTGIVSQPHWYTNAKVVQIQRQASDDHLEFVKFLKHIQPEYGFRLVYNIDDVPFKEHIPDYNSFKFAFDTDKVRQNVIDIMNLCDEVVVTCDYMRDTFRDVTGKKEITVIPNFPPHFWIGHLFDRKKRYDNYDKHKRKPRILYTGSGAHFDIDGRAGGKDDFEEMVKFVVDTRTKYQWVFLGSAPPALQRYANEIEVHPWEPLLSYPRKIIQLEPCMTIAPLQSNSFNKSKSDIKYVESAMLGVPCLLQNIETYNTAPPKLRFDTIDEFAAKVEERLNYKNKSKYYKEIDEVRAYGETRFLEHPQNIGCFFELMMTPYGDPQRRFLKRYNS